MTVMGEKGSQHEQIPAKARLRLGGDAASLRTMTADT